MEEASFVLKDRCLTLAKVYLAKSLMGFNFIVDEARHSKEDSKISLMREKAVVTLMYIYLRLSDPMATVQLAQQYQRIVRKSSGLFLHYYSEALSKVGRAKEAVTILQHLTKTAPPSNQGLNRAEFDSSIISAASINADNASVFNNLVQSSNLITAQWYANQSVDSTECGRLLLQNKSFPPAWKLLVYTNLRNKRQEELVKIIQEYQLAIPKHLS